MRYFVTGATGFIGGRVVRQLVAAGHQVVALVRQPERARDLADLGVELHAGDITDPDSLRAPMRGADGIFHLAAWYKLGARDTSAAYRINVQGTRNVLQAMQSLDIRKGVYTSTLAVFGDTHGQLVDETFYQGGPWLSEYDRTKWIAHYEIALPMIKAGLLLTIVQPGLVYGPGDTSSVRTMLDDYLQRTLPLTPQRTAYCWAHVDDTAQGHVLAMEKGQPGESYIIAGPAHTLIEALALAEHITGIPAPKLHPPPGLVRAASACMRLIEKVVPVSDRYSSEYLRVAAGATYLASNAKAGRELGFAPRPLATGLQQTLAHEMKLLGMKQA